MIINLYPVIEKFYNWTYFLMIYYLDVNYSFDREKTL